MQAPALSFQERRESISSLEIHVKKIPEWAAAIKTVVLDFKEQHLDDGAILGKKRHQGM